MGLAERLLPRRIGEGLRRRVLGLVEGFLSGFTSLSRRSGDLTLMLALSLAAAVIDAGVFYLMFASLGARVPAMVVLFHALNAVILGLSGGAAMWALGFSPAAAFRSAAGAPESELARPAETDS